MERDRFDEMRDHMNVVFESLRGEIRVLAEGHGYVVEAIGDLRDGQADLIARYDSLRVGQDSLRAGQADLIAKYNSLRVGQDSLVAGQTDLVAKYDFLRVGQDSLRAEQADLVAGQTDLVANNDSLLSGQAEIRAELTDFRAETREDFRSVRAAIHARDARLDDRVSRVEKDVATLKRQVKALGPGKDRS